MDLALRQQVLELDRALGQRRSAPQEALVVDDLKGDLATLQEATKGTIALDPEPFHALIRAVHTLDGFGLEHLRMLVRETHLDVDKRIQVLVVLWQW